MTSLPLAGRRVLVTRAIHQAGKLSEGLRTLGAIPVEVPILEIRPPESFEAVDLALRDLKSYDWLILTSANAVQALKQRAKVLDISLAASATRNVAAIGSATARAVTDAGLVVTLVPVAYVAESLVGALKDQMSGQKVLLARAEVARDVIPDALRSAGAKVDVVDVYRNVMPESAPDQLRQAVAEGLDAVTFTSSSSATYLADAAREARVSWPLSGVPGISIGPITSETLRGLGWPPAAEASPSDIQGLIAAVVQVLNIGVKAGRN